MTVRHSFDSCQEVVRQLSGSRQAVVRQSSGSRQAVVRQFCHFYQPMGLKGNLGLFFFLSWVGKFWKTFILENPCPNHIEDCSAGPVAKSEKRCYQRKRFIMFNRHANYFRNSSSVPNTACKTFNEQTLQWIQPFSEGSYFFLTLIVPIYIVTIYKCSFGVTKSTRKPMKFL